MINRLINNNYLMFPRILNIELTNFCPLLCRHCYKNSKTEYIDTALLQRLLKEASEIGIKRILLSGGEPLTYPNIIEVVREAKEFNLNVVISTSGYGINRDTLSQLKNSGLDELFISLNGSNADVNSLSRDGYELAVNAIYLCSEMDMTCKINWVARHDNIDDFPNLLNFAKENRVSGIDILLNKPDSSDEINSQINQQELEKLADYIRAEMGYINYQTCFSFLKNIVSSPQKSILMRGCSAGRYSLAVFCDGSFSMCPHIQANNKYESISEYWNDDEGLKEFRAHSYIGKDCCISCDFYETCLPCALIPDASLGQNCISYYKTNEKEQNKINVEEILA